MINRRMFLASVSALAIVPFTSRVKAAPNEGHLDLWEAKIRTILQMAQDYKFTKTETNGLFGWPAWDTQSHEELYSKMLDPYVRGSNDIQVRVENILAVHTWIRGRSGSCIETQLYELDRPRAGFYHPTIIADCSLGSLLRTREYCFIAMAADWCRLRMVT